MSLFSKSSQGVHVQHHKNTANKETVVMAIPDIVRISMSQHIGAPCEPTVKAGDLVKVGQIIGDTEAFMSVPIHSSVSGEVAGILEIVATSGAKNKLIEIKTDKLQEPWEGIAIANPQNKEEFLKAVKDSGLVGLGGAAFPTHIKFNPKNSDEVKTLIVNGAECEPYITADVRCMLEDTEHIVDGILVTLKHLSMDKCIIGIEDNKPEAIAKLTQAVRDYPQITVQALHAIYPQGAERVLIYETTGIILPDGKLPGDVGVLVSNIASIAFISKYLKTGMPLVSKRLTVDGDCIGEPKNLEVLIGTRICDIIEFVGGYQQQPSKILMGGPMMGMAIIDDEMPVVKNNNAILAFSQNETKEVVETNCIRCGRCVRACPLNLMPTAISEAYEHKDLEALEKLSATLCMNCGCCSYVCPAKKQLALENKMAKAFVMESKRR